MNICYEDLFGEEIRLGVLQAQASVLANVSNLGWFGRSSALDQHLAISRFRSIETGRPMLRATNTGMTAAIDHRGRVLVRLAPHVEGALDATVQGMQGLTPYARFGQAPWLVGCALGLALMAFIARRRPPD
jgi:apolipoprotein N-acyltransferase